MLIVFDNLRAGEGNMAVMGPNNKSIIRLVWDKFKELVTDEKVQNSFIDTLVDREIAKRSVALAQLWELIQKQENDIRKIKPDLERYAEDGTIVDVSYSKGQLEALKKSKERLEKMSKAFEKGWNGEMGDVYNLVKDKGSSGKEDS